MSKPRIVSDSVCARVDFKIRKHHVDYLNRIASIDDTSLSRAFGNLVGRHEGRHAGKENQTPAQKARLDLRVASPHLAIIDRLCMRWGMSRSDVARRLIDGALEKEG